MALQRLFALPHKEIAQDKQKQPASILGFPFAYKQEPCVSEGVSLATTPFDIPS